MVFKKMKQVRVLVISAVTWNVGFFVQLRGRQD